jgi:hypothetical protein
MLSKDRPRVRRVSTGMKTKPFLTPLLALSCSLAAAAPSAPTPPSPPTEMPAPICQQGADILFQIESKLESPTFEVPTSRTTLYATGAWTRVDRDGKGKLTRTASGCVTKDDLAQVEALLAHAPWKIKQAQAACAAVFSTYTEFSSHGKVLWDQHVCQLSYLDQDSDRALRTIDRLLEDVSKPGPIGGTGPTGEGARGKP